MRCQIWILVDPVTKEYVRCDAPGRRCLTRGALIALALHLCNGHAVALDAIPTKEN
jgi:hypothetical protein